MQIVDGVKISDPRGSNNRRISAKKRLEAQLKLGTKPTKRWDTSLENPKLTESDIKRIEKEIKILKSRIK